MRTIGAVAAATLALAGAVSTVGGAAVGSTGPPRPLQVIAGTHPTWATSATFVRLPLPTMHVTADIQLRLRDEAGALALLRDITDPGSAGAAPTLTAAEFAERFAPLPATVAAVSQAARASGVRVVAVPSNRRYVEIDGTVTAADRLFGVRLGLYRVDGRLRLASAGALTLPTGLAGQVLTVTGIGDALSRPGAVRHAATGADRPSGQLPPPSQCSAYWDEHTQRMPSAYGRTSFPTLGCGYSPQQLQRAYGIASGFADGQDGRGTKVAIVDAFASPTLESDANQRFTNAGTPTFRRAQFSTQSFRPFTDVAACGGKAVWYQEQSLDVEALHASAPGADQLYVGAQNCGGGLDRAENWVVANVDNPASKAFGVSMISNSWDGIGEAQSQSRVLAETAIFVQAGLEGIGVYFASGDYGDNAGAGLTTTPQPDEPASSPYVTAVGGTTLAVTESSDYGFETGWGTHFDKVVVRPHGANGYKRRLPGAFLYGSTGGTSTLFPEPWYQRGIVPAALSRAFDGTRNRVVPDVSMDGDPYEGMLTGLTSGGSYVEYPIGGTSLACPLFVGLQADVQGAGPAIGFADPLLYAMHGSAFHDIVPPAAEVAVATPSGGFLVTADHDTSLVTTAGYDDVTGRGSPDWVTFAQQERALVP